MTDTPAPVPDTHIQEIAERVAARALNDSFRLLGIDIGAMEDVNQFRDDVRFIRRQRSIVETRRTEILKSAVAAMIGGCIGMLLSAITWLVTVLRHPS
jgi:hypothetical protein